MLKENDKMNNQKNKKRRLLLGLSALVIAMFFFSYALVPLYNVLCDALWINGKTSGKQAEKANTIDKSRTITVQFIATRNANLPWEFHPMIHTIEIHPGENRKINYYAKNNTDHEMTVQAVPSVTPGLAASHLKKIECFCFNQQTLSAHTETLMPLIFHVDDALPKDINTITLSYTLFAVKNKSKTQTRKQPGRIN